MKEMAGKRKRQDHPVDPEEAFERFKEAVARIAAVPKSKLLARAPNSPGKKPN